MQPRSPRSRPWSLAASSVTVLACLALGPRMVAAQCPEGTQEQSRGACVPMVCETRQDCASWYEELCGGASSLERTYCGTSIACVPVDGCVVETPYIPNEPPMSPSLADDCSHVAPPATCRCGVSLCMRSPRRVAVVATSTIALPLVALFALVVIVVVVVVRRRRAGAHR